MKKGIDLNETYEKAKETIFKCATENGLYASGGEKGYKGVWARDSIIALVGASSDDKPIFKEQFKKSLETLKKGQSKLGQIPNAIHGFEAKKIQNDYSTIDSSLWFIIGHYFYKTRYKDNSLFKKHRKAIEKAYTWLTYQDIGEDGILRQLPTTDWQDAFPHKYGSTINTGALHFKVLNLLNKKSQSKLLLKNLHDNPEKKLWNGKFYYAYRWKNHNKYKEIGTWFDTLGNLLAIIFGLSDGKTTKKILKYIRKNKISRPYPSKAIDPPIKPESPYWQDYYLDCSARNPGHYLNGGIWPFIGGFYILALIKIKKYRRAKKFLKLLAESNTKEKIFPEWIDPKTKKPHGIHQAWSAGMYICAHNSLKNKKILF